MYEEDVAADGLKLFFSGLNIPDAKLLCVLLRLRMKEEVMGLELCVIEQDNEGQCRHQLGRCY